MGKQLDRTIDLIEEIKKEDKNFTFMGLAGTRLTTNNLLSNIAVSLAIIADETIRANDFIMKIEEKEE